VVKKPVRICIYGHIGALYALRCVGLYDLWKRVKSDDVCRSTCLYVKGMSDDICVSM